MGRYFVILSPLLALYLNSAILYFWRIIFFPLRPVLSPLPYCPPFDYYFILLLSIFLFSFYPLAFFSFFSIFSFSRPLFQIFSFVWLSLYSAPTVQVM
jgi:hypothetical protein